MWHKYNFTDFNNKNDIAFVRLIGMDFIIVTKFKNLISFEFDYEYSIKELNKLWDF